MSHYRNSASLVSDSLSCYAFFGGPHANWNREVDWGTEIRGHEPVWARDYHRFRPCLEQSARPDGACASGAGCLHRHRRGHDPREEAAEARIAGGNLFWRTSHGTADRL